jgi:hypothetical protein
MPFLLALQFSDLLNFEYTSVKLLCIIVIQFVPFASEITSTFFFCSLSLLFQLSYIYDVHLSAVNSHHNITIELSISIHEFHVNANNIDIKMLVLMSLDLLLLTEGFLNWIELNGIWVRALPGPMHLSLRTGPLCPMFSTKLEEPCSFIKVPGDRNT